MAIGKKINTSLSTSVKEESNRPKLTSDIIATYLDLMGGEKMLVKPDGSQYNPDRKGRVNVGDRLTTAEKFGQAGDVGLNNQFTKLPEVHARFDDRMTALQVQKEIATGRLTTQKFFEVPNKEIANQAADEIRRSPDIQLGRGETVEVRPVKGGFEVVAVKQYQPIPSRGNTLVRTYGAVEHNALKNDPTGIYVAFNKPEEAYSAPKSLKELQAEIRSQQKQLSSAYKELNASPDMTKTEYLRAIKPMQNVLEGNEDLRQKAKLVLDDIRSRTDLPITPEPQSRLTEYIKQQAIAPNTSARLNPATDTGGWANAVGEPFRPSRNALPVDISKPRFSAEMGLDTNPTGLSDRGRYNRIKATYEADNFELGDRLKPFPDFYELDRQAKAEGVRPEAFQNYIKGKAEAPLIEFGIMRTPELPLTARLGQEYISPKSGKVGTVESVGKKGVKLNVDGQVVPLEYKTLERLKYTGNKGYGFATPAALRPALGGFAGGTVGSMAFKQLAKAAGLNEDQQNAAAATGGLIGSLTGSALTNVRADTKLRLPTAGEFAKTMMSAPQQRSAGARLFDLASSQSGALSMEQRQKALDFNQQYDSGAIAKRGSSLSEPEDLGLGRALTPEEFARKFPDKAKDFGLEVKPQPETIFPKYEPKRLSKEPKKVALQDFQVGQEVVSLGKGFQGRVTNIENGQVTLENYQGKQRAFTVEALSQAVAPAEYRQPLQLGEYDYKAQRTPKEAIPSLPKNAFPSPAKDLKFTPASKVPFDERYLQNKGFKITYNDPSSGVIEVKPPDLVPVNGKSLKLNDYLAASKEWRTNALTTTDALRDLDYQIPLTDKQGRTALEQAIFEANNSLPPAPSRADFMVDPPKQKLKEFLSRGSKPYVPESMSNVDNLKQAMSQAEALGDVESQMNIAKQLEKVQSKRVVKKSSGGGFGKAKQAIAQTVQNVTNTVLDTVYQPSKSQPKQSTFISESAVEAAAKSTGATTAQVKAQIANQRVSGNAPDLNKATEAIAAKSQSAKTRSLQGVTLPEPRMQLSGLTTPSSVDNGVGRQAAFERANLAFEANTSTPPVRSLKELNQSARYVLNPPMPEPTSRAKTPVYELPAADLVPLKNPNTIIDRRINQIDSALKTPVGGKIADRIGASGIGIFMDTAQAAQVLTESASRGEKAPVALARAGLSVGAGYGATALASLVPNTYARTALQIGGGIAAVVGADKLIDQVVGRNEAKEQKFAKDLSKLDLQATNEKEQWKPFANDSNLAAAYGNSLTAQVQQNLDYRPAARSLANLTNSQSIENARYASERDTSIKTGVEAKSKRSIAYEDRGNGVTVAYGRDRGYTSTESRVLALQNLANESGYEVPRTGKFEGKTLDALEKMGYSQSQISEYLKGKRGEAIGKPESKPLPLVRSKSKFGGYSAPVQGSELSAALSAERKAQGLKGGEMLNQGQVDQVFSSLAGRSLTQLRQSAKVGGKSTQSALRLGAGIR